MENIEKYLLSESQVQPYIKSCVDVVNSLGYNLNRDEFIFSLAEPEEINEDGCAFGSTGLSQNSDKIELKINKYIATSDMMGWLLNTILHELGHVIQFKYAIDHKFIVRTNNEWQRANIDNSVYSFLFGTTEERGHSRFWLSVVNKINQLGFLQWPITPVMTNDDEFEKYIGEFEYYGSPKYKVICKKCGFKLVFNSSNSGIDLLEMRDIVLNKTRDIPNFVKEQLDNLLKQVKCVRDGCDANGYDLDLIYSNSNPVQ